MTELPETKDVLIAMLKENTGEHFLDSGGAYGRSWQQNQAVDFDAVAPSRVEFDLCNGWISVTKDIYHYMLDNLSITEKSQEIYEEFLKFAEDHPNTKWYELYDIFPEYLNEIEYIAKGWECGGGCNSYNHESSVSQVYQFRVLSNEDEDIHIIVLEIHGGCDVRGGYTDPKFFECNNDEGEYFGYNDNDYSIVIGKNDYYTDDGSHWYCDGCLMRDNDKNDILKCIRESVEQGLVPGVEPDEKCFVLKSDDLNCLYIEYKHKSDNCRTLDEFIEV
jgi:hypothetical protein